MHLVRDEVMDDGLIVKMKARNVFLAIRKPWQEPGTLTRRWNEAWLG